MRNVFWDLAKIQAEELGKGATLADSLEAVFASAGVVPTRVRVRCSGIPDLVIKLASAEMGCHRHQIKGSSRVPSLVRARWVVCQTLWQLGYSLKAIGNELLRDHSTVVHALREIEKHPNLMRIAKCFADEIQHGVGREEKVEAA